MAAAEARAGWQRTANRYFSQEDVKRAPKISSGPSSSFSKSQSDAGHGHEPNGSNCPASGYIPRNRNRDPPSETKWWLHLQPNFEHQVDFMYEQLNSLEAELEVMSAGYADQVSKISRDYEPSADNSRKIGMKHNVDLFPDQPWKVSAACFKNEHDTSMPELKVALGNTPQKAAKNMDMGELWYPDDNLMDMDPLNCSVSKQPNKLSYDWDSQWIEAEKNEPWWRTADKDELASLVAQKSLEHIENCDLPRPQAKHFRRGPSASLECFGHDGMLNSSLDRNPEMGCSSLTNCVHGSPTSVSLDDKHCILGDMVRTVHGSDIPFSDNENHITNKADMQNDSEHSPSKAQLLEALCHSQTRAREAEKAAQEAYTEKEHVIKLFFKQASQLFAYKQWFHLLQLENLCLQLKNKNGPVSTLFPVALPWVPYKGSQLKKGRHKAAKRKRIPPWYEISKSTVAFAVGLSLAGAGLLLGWTMGWLFPVF